MSSDGDCTYMCYKNSHNTNFNLNFSLFLDRSDTSDGCAAAVPGEASGEDESAAMLSDDHAPVSPCESNETDDTTYFMPWLKVIYYNFFSYYIYLID